MKSGDLGRNPIDKPQLIEINLEIDSQEDFDFIEMLLTRLGKNYYIMPVKGFRDLKNLIDYYAERE